MSVFVDTDVFYAAHDEASERHENAIDGLRRIVAGEYGAVYTSDYVLDETVTLVRSRTDSVDAPRTVADRLLGRGEFPEALQLLIVDRERVQRTLATVERYADHDLSFTDASTVALVEDERIDRVCSFDDDFDGIVDRLVPWAQ